MHVTCKKCGENIPVAGRPTGSTSAKNISTEGPVKIGGGGIAFKPGGKLSFRQGGSIGFGPPRASQFMCRACGHTASYEASEILD